MVAADGAEAEIVIWNPDGSVAEFSGNGSRIAAAWLAARAGAERVTISAGGRTYPASVRDDGTIAMAVGDVEVGEIETVEIDGERDRADRGLGRQPARGRARDRWFGPSCSGSGRGSRRATASPSARTSSSCASTARTR